MTKWEYRIEKFPMPSDWKNSKESSWEDMRLNHYEILNKLGQEGWEYMMTIGTLFYFKKQIEEEIPVYKDGVRLEKSRMYTLKEGI